MAEQTATIHAPGSKVWIKDESESWAKAEVVKLQGGELVVSVEGSGLVKSVRPEDAPLQNQDARGVEDMTRLSYLHEPGVLWNLRTRYALDDIYTYTGSILIAVNPFAALPHLYGAHMMDQYRGVDLGDLSPHVYAIADAAYRQMRKEMKGQSILVSGESGAGKTETSKLIMKYLAYMGGYNEAAAGRAASGGGRSVEEQVLESNPLLEAFGNAKTVRNNNSSRFGKYVEINFNKAGGISGAAIRTYLLERSRVVSINNPERSYHIFYQICDGASAEERKRWRLRPASEFAYLNQSSCYEIPGDSNAEEYAHTVSAMAKVGIPPALREAVLRTTVAVLHMGNIAFEEGDSGDDSSRVAASGPTADALAATAELLGVDPRGLEHSLTTRTRQTHDGPIVSPLNVKAATENRDALAKTIYAKMFDWLVAAINAAIGEDPNAAASVGVLDIYGFESFEYNDLEQFCINLANEKLQQHFNHHVFKQEQAEYEREAIDWSYISFVDNQDVLDLIEGRLGVLDLLDEQCRFPTATAKDLAEKLYSSDVCKGSARFKRPKLSQTAFTLEHYAGPVVYQADNFLDKNKDFVVAEHQALLQASSQEFVRTLFPPPAEATASEAGGKGGVRPSLTSFKFNSVGSQFKRQLGELMVQLNQMEPHYIRCIKPNGQNKPGIFENSNALHQLRCGGVLEAVRISCAGFPNKRPFPDFVDHFWPLAPDLYHRGDLDDRAISEGILQRSGLVGYQLGKSKVFLRAGQMAVLDRKRADSMGGAATVVQRHVRGLLARLRYRQATAAILKLQAGGRGMLARRDARFRRQTRAATVVQAAWRRHQLQQEYRGVQEAVTRVQALWRGRRARAEYAERRREAAANAIQAAFRMTRARGEYIAQREAAVVLQGAFRVRCARRDLASLKTEAREAGRLLEDKKALERKMVEVQETLQRVQGQRNDLRQEVKELRAALEAAAQRLRDQEAGQEAALEAARREAAETAAAEAAAAASAAGEVAALTAALATAQEEATAQRSDLTKKLHVAQDYIQRLMAEKSELDKRFHAMKEELIQRLQNACAQRDEARGQVMELEDRVQKQDTKIVAQAERLQRYKAALAVAQQQQQAAVAASNALREGGAVSPAATGPAAAAAAAAAAVAGLSNGAAPAGAQTPDMLARLSKQATGYMQQMASAPGLARMVESAGSLLTTPEQGPAAGPRGGSEGGAAAAHETELERRTRELQAKQAQLLQERRRQEEDRLLAALAKPMGFHKGRPLAALIVFRSCLQWRSFQADRTSIFDRIIQVIGSQIERQQDDNACLAYWLSNTVTLLHLLQRNIKPASGGSLKNRAAVAGRSMLGGLFGRGVAAGDASIHGGGVGGFRMVEAKYPALLFKQQLDAFVQKVFPMMRDNVKKAITPLLSACIHTPRTHGRGASAASAAATRRPSGDAPGSGGGSGAAAATPVKSWQDILGVLDALLATCQENHVPQPLVQALFKQLFSFVNVQLFNQLLLRRECCSFSNGEYVKTGLALVESWIETAGPDLMADSWEELKFIRQAVTFLVIGNKPRKALDEITRDLCPVLSIQQLYRISTMYWDDKYNTETVSSAVLAAMKQRMVDSSAASTHSFLLDDDSTLPFSAAEVCAQMDDKDLYMALPVPEALREGDGGAAWYSFLEKELRFSSM